MSLLGQAPGDPSPPNVLPSSSNDPTAALALFSALSLTNPQPAPPADNSLPQSSPLSSQPAPSLLPNFPSLSFPGLPPLQPASSNLNPPLPQNLPPLTSLSPPPSFPSLSAFPSAPSLASLSMPSNPGFPGDNHPGNSTVAGIGEATISSLVSLAQCLGSLNLPSSIVNAVMSEIVRIIQNERKQWQELFDAEKAKTLQQVAGYMAAWQASVTPPVVVTAPASAPTTSTTSTSPASATSAPLASTSSTTSSNASSSTGAAAASSAAAAAPVKQPTRPATKRPTQDARSESDAASSDAPAPQRGVSGHPPAAAWNHEAPDHSLEGEDWGNDEDLSYGGRGGRGRGMRGGYGPPPPRGGFSRGGYNNLPRGASAERGRYDKFGRGGGNRGRGGSYGGRDGPEEGWVEWEGERDLYQDFGGRGRGYRGGRGFGRGRGGFEDNDSYRHDRRDPIGYNNPREEFPSYGRGRGGYGAPHALSRDVDGGGYSRGRARGYVRGYGGPMYRGRGGHVRGDRDLSLGEHDPEYSLDWGEPEGDKEGHAGHEDYTENPGGEHAPQLCPNITSGWGCTDDHCSFAHS
eukprot:TRINITY_DN4640_c0_g1_i1.p1 TRINITY_DN4640_c0_g1~~TRINITY_DN4640_c0_g1_i1.p1  ORF type:complete len:650 (-),score=70.93 TRINITY_DN4640_c0_g1_i1:66-1790(-)